jgi:AcrR family transcriptional regulator
MATVGTGSQGRAGTPGHPLRDAPAEVPGAAVDAAGTRVEEPPRAPGRPRSACVDQKIIDAVLDLLAEGTGFAAISIEAVAARAGVGKATIYRRWASKNALLLDAVRALKTPQPPLSGRSLREDLIELLNVVSVSADPRAERVFPCLVPEVIANPDLQELYQQIVEPRRERVRAVLRRGIEAGELRPDIDIELIALLLSAPLMVQRMLAWNPRLAADTLTEKVVDTVLAGIAAD